MMVPLDKVIGVIDKRIAEIQVIRKRLLESPYGYNEAVEKMDCIIELERVKKDIQIAFGGVK